MHSENLKYQMHLSKISKWIWQYPKYKQCFMLETRFCVLNTTSSFLLPSSSRAWIIEACSLKMGAVCTGLLELVKGMYTYL